MEHSTLRIRAELGSAIPEGMFGFVQVDWFDPKNPIGSTEVITHQLSGKRDNYGDALMHEMGIISFVNDQTEARARMQITQANAGDNYIIAVHPNTTGIASYCFEEDDETLEHYDPKRDETCALQVGRYQTSTLTVWRTLWMELDQMAAPVAPTAANPVSDGFELAKYYNDGQYTGVDCWDHEVPSPEPEDFDVLEQPDKPDITLAASELEKICIEVREWEDNAVTTIPFSRDVNAEMMSNSRFDASVRNIFSHEDVFWYARIVGAFDFENKDLDGNVNGFSGGYLGVAIYDTAYILNETIRDFHDTFIYKQSYTDMCSNLPFLTMQSTVELKRRIVLHEILHFFNQDDEVIHDGYAITPYSDIINYTFMYFMPNEYTLPGEDEVICSELISIERCCSIQSQSGLLPAGETSANGSASSED